MESQLMNLEENSTLVQQQQQQQHEQKNKNDDKIRPWVDLPSELLGLVFSGLYDPDHISFSSIRDRIGFRLTCKGWQSSVRCLPGGQFPFLMSLKPRKGTTGAVTFLNPITNKEIQVFDDCYDMRSAKLHCSRFGWLLMSRNNILFFYNPFISGTTIKLPPFSGGRTIVGYMDSMSFTAPPTSSDCIVYVHGFYDPTKPREVIGIYRWCYGEDDWTCYLIDCQLPFGKSSGNPILYRSVFYQLNKCGRLGISDPKKGNEQHIWKDLPRPKPLKKKNIYSPYTKNKKKRMWKQPPKPQEEDIIRTHHYMAECDGKLVMVCVDYKELYQVQSVHVFELDWNRMEWVTVQSLGNKAMFISEAESLLINMTDGGGAENKIYFPAFVRTKEDGSLIYPISKYFADDIKVVRATKKVGVFYCLKNHEFNSQNVYWDWASSCTWIDSKFQP